MLNVAEAVLAVDPAALVARTMAHEPVGSGLTSVEMSTVMSPLLGDGLAKVPRRDRAARRRIDRALDRDYVRRHVGDVVVEAVNWTRVVCVVVLTVIDTAVEVRAPPALSRATAVRL